MYLSNFFVYFLFSSILWTKNRVSFIIFNFADDTNKGQKKVKDFWFQQLWHVKGLEVIIPVLMTRKAGPIKNQRFFLALSKN